MKPADLQSLQEYQAVTREAASSDDVATYARLDFDWHRERVQLSGNPVLLRSWEALRIRPRIGPLVRDLGLSLEALTSQHDAILSAMESKNGALAGKLRFCHAMGVANRIIRLAAESPEDPKEAPWQKSPPPRPRGEAEGLKNGVVV